MTYWEYDRVPADAVPADAVWHQPRPGRVLYSHGSPEAADGPADSGARYARDRDPRTGTRTYYQLKRVNGERVRHRGPSRAGQGPGTR